MHANFLLLLLVNIVTMVVIITYIWHRRQFFTGLVLTYLIFFSAAYILQGVIYALPWYAPLYDPEIVYIGFSAATLALVCFSVGFLFLVPFFRIFKPRSPNSTSLLKNPLQQREKPANSNLWILYILTGLFVYFVLQPLLGRIPTFSAFLSGIYRLFPIGIIIGFWTISTSSVRQSSKTAFLLVSAIGWPLITIINDGFLGFGLYPSVFVFVFVVLRSKRPLRLVLLLTIGFYLGLSLLVTYLGGRAVIRSVVWNTSSLETRVSTVASVLTQNFQFFDITNPEHLAAIDGRLRQDQLTGLGIQRIEGGVIPLANGETVIDALLMLVPRALWTDKDISVGGQSLVNYYTGVYLGGNSAIALGQVLETYVNFGLLGIIAGFIGFGVLLHVIDEIPIRKLKEGDYYSAALWLVPMFGLLLTEANFLTTTSTTVSGWFSVYLFNAIPRILTSSKLRFKLGDTNRVFRGRYDL